MSNKLIKEAVLEVQKECILLAEEQDKKTQQKCAQVILAASGLRILREKMRPLSIGRN